MKRLNNVLPPRGCGMFIAQYLKQLHRPTVEATTGLEPPIDSLRDHVFWAFIAKRDKYPTDADLRTLAGADLQNMVGQMMVGWQGGAPSHQPAATLKQKMFGAPQPGG